MAQSVLITGVAGFIGSNMAKELLKAGCMVRGVDDLSSSDLQNLREVAPDVDFWKADVRDPTMMARACKGVDVVIHAAAIASATRSVDAPMKCHDVNLSGCLNMLESAKQQGVRRFLFASSAAVYGDEPGLPKSESAPARPVTPYGAQKLSCEHYLHSYWRLYGLETVALRYFNVFGPNQNPDSPYSGVLAIFAQRSLNGASVTIYGDGETSRDFTYVDNVTAANRLAMDAPSASVSGRVFNIAAGRAVTLNEALRTIQRATGRLLPPTYAKARIGDIRRSVADISLAREVLGYVPGVDFEEGVRRTLAWVERNYVKKTYQLRNFLAVHGELSFRSGVSSA